jgi:hypothetical protein
LWRAGLVVVQQKDAKPRYEVILSQINFTGVPRSMSVTYTAVLEASEDTVLFLSTLLHAERERRGTRKSTRALSTYKQAALVLRWFLEDARMSALARDNAIAASTAYSYRDEGVAVLAVEAGRRCTGRCWRPRRPGTRM